MTPELEKQTLSGMEKVFDHFKNDVMKMRSNKPSAALVDFIKFKDCYGSESTIKHVANIIANDNSIIIQPWDTKNIYPIEKAIIDANVGLTPNTAATSISINVPKLTVEKINDLVKILHNLAEDSRISVRNVRRTIKEIITKMKKDSEISEDDEKKYNNVLQKHTDAFISRIDEMAKKKEEELRKV